MSYTLTIKKDYLKFSASHFTIFSKDKAEALHGHNYYISARLTFAQVDELEMTAEFNLIKKALKDQCDLLDEKVLLPKDCSLLKIMDSTHYEKHTEVIFQHKHYCFPNEDIFSLPVKNITSEALARYLHSQLIGKIKNVNELLIDVSETSGQSASFTSIN